MVDANSNANASEFDSSWSRKYRSGDEDVIVRSDSFRHYSDILASLCPSGDRRIDVLDVGCGTGRHFHRLRNVRRLVGIDLSPHMIEQARRPVRASEVTAESVELIAGDVFSAPLADGSFDLVYSIGVYGEYAPFDDALLQRLCRLMRPGGRLFITAVDSASRVSEPENATPSLPRRAVRKLFPLLPARLRRALNRRLSPHYASRAQVEAVLGRSGLDGIEVTAYPHVSGWRGVHFDCLAIRPLD